MTVSKLFTVCACGLLLVACSDSSNNQAAKPENPAPAAQTQSTAPQGQQPLSAAQQAAIAAAKDLPKEGTVMEMMHAAGYTYMKMDVGADQPMWIAASMMRVKPQQRVKWSDAAVMTNFPSKSLHRTFDQILFVSNAQVAE